MNISFEKANTSHLDIIFGWLAEHFVQEFWDNTQGHKDDILNFVNGRKEPSNYCDGKYVYWIASSDGHPFAMLMTIQETAKDHIDDIKLSHLSKTGNTYGIDYMIGNPKFFGKGYGSQTLSDFIDYFREIVDPKADTFIIDPTSDNPKAKHVYMKAGFEHIDDFVMVGDCSGTCKLHHLLIRKFAANVELLQATITDHPVIQKLWPFYVYDLGRECLDIKSWEWPTDESFMPDDITPFFNDLNKKVFLIKVGNELAGFIFIDKSGVTPDTDFHLSEFFISAKFQNKGIGTIAATKLFHIFKGKWAISIIKENKKALVFWRKIISEAYNCDYREIFKTEDELKTTENLDPYAMNVFTFDTNNNANNAKDDISIYLAQIVDIPSIVEMSHQKRRLYEKAQPQFWRYAGDSAEISQAKWFKELLGSNDNIMLTAVRHKKIVGFIIGRLMPAPEVYNPGGLTLMIDDFCVEDQAEWHSIGSKLTQEIKAIAKTKGAAQVLVVCGAHDGPKRHFLKKMGLTVASEWYVGNII